MNKIMFILMFFFGVSSFCFASEPSDVNPEQVKLNLINQLETDGYLSHKMADEVKIKYINVEKMTQIPTSSNSNMAVASPSNSNNKEAHSGVNWNNYLSWVNCFKIFAVGLLLIAFAGTISKFIRHIWHLIVQVPVEVFQIVFLANSLAATVFPQKFWESQAIYVALFGSFANLLIIGWILATHEKLAEKLEKFLSFLLPAEAMASFLGLVYFAFLTHLFHSPILGVCAVICLSGFFSINIYYSCKKMSIDFHHRNLTAFIWGHLVIIFAYIFFTFQHTLPQELYDYRYGLEYYCTIAACIGLLIGASPFEMQKHSPFFYSIFFVAIFIASMTGFYMFHLEVIGSIVCCAFILFILEWVAYFSYQSGLIWGAGILGVFLYGLAMGLEKYGHYLILYSH